MSHPPLNRAGLCEETFYPRLIPQNVAFHWRLMAERPDQPFYCASRHHCSPAAAPRPLSEVVGILPLLEASSRSMAARGGAWWRYAGDGVA